MDSLRTQIQAHDSEPTHVVRIISKMIHVNPSVIISSVSMIIVSALTALKIDIHAQLQSAPLAEQQFKRPRCVDVGGYLLRSNIRNI